jgi:putative acetyltransferase
MISVRDEIPQDRPLVHQIHSLAFEQADEAELVDTLRSHSKAIISLVAEDNGRAVGHILFSPAVLDAGDKQLLGFGLAPLAVLPERQNEGIGTLLVERGLERCREMRAPFVVVLGHPDYYPRFGFVPASRYGIRTEFDVLDEAFMILELDQNALENFAGIAKYQKEFDQFR